MQHIHMDVPAAQLAVTLIDDAGLTGRVRLEDKGDQRGFDHYDSDDATINLIDHTRDSLELYSGFVAAHEVGHAILDQRSPALKKVFDQAAYLMDRRATPSLVAFFSVGTLFLWQWVAYLALGLIAAQLVAALVIQVVEAFATQYAHRLINDRFELSEAIKNALKDSGRAALAAHAHDIAWPAALLLILSLIFNDICLPSLVVLASLALVFYAACFTRAWLSQLMRTTSPIP